MPAAARLTALLARIAAFVLFGLLLTRNASALSIQAPAGGATIALPADRLLCTNPPDGWTADATRKHLKPPATGRIGQTSDVTLASTSAGCTNGNADPATLIVTGPLPVIDVQSVTLSVDAGRLEVRGDGLEGMLVSWRSDVRAGADRCLNVGKANGRDVCALDVDRKLPADPRAIVLRWAPRGGRADADSVTYDQAGAALTDEQSKLPVAKILVSRVFGTNNTVDVSSGEGRVNLVHPEAVSSVDCGTSRCDNERGGIHGAGRSGDDDEPERPPASHTSRPSRARRRAGRRVDRDALGPALPADDGVRGADAQRGQPQRARAARPDVRQGQGGIKMDRGRRAGGSGPRRDAPRWRLKFLPVRDRTNSGDRLTLVATRQDDGSVLAVASEKTWESPPLRTSLSLPSFGDIDFIPKNRPAVLTVSPVLRTGRLVPISVPRRVHRHRTEGRLPYPR